MKLVDFQKLTKREQEVELLKWSDSYYNLSISLVPDNVFDDCYDYYVSQYPESPFLYTIGANVKQSAWKKASHKIAMNSLNKETTLGGLTQWAQKCSEKRFIVSQKLDGISIGLEYENGNLVKAITRGDGIIGEDITVNVRKMQNVRLDAPELFTGSLRGEIILRQSDFETVNALCESRGEDPFKNLRNGASGIAKNRNGKYVEYLTIIYYDCTGNFETKWQKFNFLSSKFGLTTCLVASEANINKIHDIIEKYEKTVRAELDYEIDGLVIEVDNVVKYAQLGNKHKKPLGGIAYKFSALKRETIIEGVAWQLGKSGQLTPVALLRPIAMGGVTVSRASLHNLENYKTLGLRYGDVVIVSRRNDVIPYIEGLSNPKVRSISKEIPIQFRCPSCNEKTEEDGKFLVCPNNECPGKEVGDLKKWIEKIGVKGQGVGESTIDKLYEAGLLKTPADFYTLDKNKIARLEGFGERSAEKLLTALNDKKQLTLPEFIGGLNLKNFSSSMAELLVDEGYITLEQFLELKVDTLVKVKGIEMTTALAFVSGLARKYSSGLLEQLMKVGIEIIAAPEPPEADIIWSGGGFDDLVFTNESFCFTGKIERVGDDGKRFTRSMMEELVVKNGGTIGKVKKGLTYLVQADPESTSTKSRKAQQLGIKILSEIEFFTRLIGR